MPSRGRLLLPILLFISVIVFLARGQIKQIPLAPFDHQLDDYPQQGIATSADSHQPGHTSQPNPATNMGESKGFRSVVYFVNWAIYGRKHFPWELPVENLTHVLYAFANVRPETGEVYLTDSWADQEIHWDGDKWEDGKKLYGCLKQLNLLKRRNRNLKIMLSIGGWTYSSNFKSGAGTPANRANFARTAVNLLKNYGFDGLDIDWEYPSNDAEASDWVALLKACREEMDAYARTLPPSTHNPRSGHRHHFELSVACPAGPSNFQKLHLAEMDRYLDFWNLMAYDYAGSWDSVVGHQANLYPVKGNNSNTTPFSTAHALAHYTRFVDPSRIVVGMPLYGRGFENTAGVGRPYSGLPEGSWERGIYDFKVLPLPGAKEYYDHEAGASYCYDEHKRVFVSYDTVPMAREKAGYIRAHHLGGAMWWESSGDRKGRESLIGNVVDALGGQASLRRDENCLEYPESQWENVRNGFRD